MTRASLSVGRTTRVFIVALWGVTAVLAGRPAAQASSGTEPGEFVLVHAGQRTTRAQIDERLTPLLREALDRWSEPAERLGLGVVLGERPEHLVLGHAPEKQLVEAARWMDQAFALVDPLVPVAEGRSSKPTVAILMDQDSQRSEAWAGLLDELGRQQLLIPEAVAQLAAGVQGVTLRQTPLFVQPTFDVAGNAAAGDDEFRLGNEVVHKYSQCLLTVRAGQQPESLLWGLGYVVELELFGSAYHFNKAGFVATGEHFDWPVKARQLLEQRRKQKAFSLAALAAERQSAGRAEEPQLLTWAALAYLSRQRPQALRELLVALSELQAEADPYGVLPDWRGDAARTAALLEQTLGAIELKELSAWLKKRS